MNFIEDLGIHGHLQIAKVDKLGKEEIIFDDHNIIVSGMGVVLATLLAGAGNTSVTGFEFNRVQLGTGGSVGLEVTGTNALGTRLTLAEYGSDSDILTVRNSLYRGGSVDTNIPFLRIPQSKVTRINNNSVRYTIVIDEEACNNKTLNEIGLFCANPFGTTPFQSVMVAYRYFSDIAKTDDFSLIFRWTINF